MTDADSGLHVSMRLLFGIIAGLIITDLVKAFVKTISATPTFETPQQLSFLVSGASLLFVARVLVDNGLYYSRPDARTKAPAYLSRMFLIACDLVSYAFCYYIVVQVESIGNAPGSTVEALRAIAYAIVVIEALHCLWCSVALLRLDIPAGSPDREPRRSWLGRWSLVSGTGTMIGGAALGWARLSNWVDEDWCLFILFFATGSSVAYLLAMRREYLGTWNYVPPVPAPDRDVS